MKVTVQKHEDDILRGRFTIWLEKVIMSSREKYLHRLPDELTIVDDPDAEITISTTDSYPSETSEDEFVFENEELGSCFEGLSPSKQRVLIKLFVQMKAPEEIAIELKCSPQHVYNQRSRAVKYLRERLVKGENKDGK